MAVGIHRRKITLDRQQVGRYTTLGYRTVRAASRDGLSFTGASGDKHMRADRLKLIYQSRDFWRNNPIYKGMIDRAVAYIVGKGFGLQMRTKSQPVNWKIENLLWKDFWERPEIRNLQSGKMLEKMIVREAMVAGDVGAVKTNKALLQVIESEQIAGKDSFVDGIQLNEAGTPVSFYVSRYGDQGRIDRRTARPIAAKDFLFVANLDRPSSSRGVPAAQSAFSMLHRINDVCDSEAVAWQILSKLAVSIIREGGPEQGYATSGTDPESTGNDTDFTTRLTELDYALLFHGNPGETVSGIERNIPGRNFSESLRMFLRLLGLPLGLPLEVVLLDWTDSNYSQSRAVLEQAFQTFLDWQDLLEEFFLDGVLAWKLDQWIAGGLIADRKDWQWEWIRPTFPWIDQLKEAQAKGDMVDRGFATHGQVCKSLSTDRAAMLDARKQEVTEAIQIAQAIEKQTGQKVSWEIFAGMKPGTEKPAAAAPEDKPEEDPEDKTNEEDENSEDREDQK